MSYFTGIRAHDWNYCSDKNVADARGATGNRKASFLPTLRMTRDEPEFSGLMFETSQDVLDPKIPGLQHFEPKDRWHCLRGTLYYLVALDTAESVLADAKQDYVAFLKGIRVE